MFTSQICFFLAFKYQWEGHLNLYLFRSDIFDVWASKVGEFFLFFSMIIKWLLSMLKRGSKDQSNLSLCWISSIISDWISHVFASSCSLPASPLWAEQPLALISCTMRWASSIILALVSSGRVTDSEGFTSARPVIKSDKHTLLSYVNYLLFNIIFILLMQHFLNFKETMSWYALVWLMYRVFLWEELQLQREDPLPSALFH